MSFTLQQIATPLKKPGVISLAVLRQRAVGAALAIAASAFAGNPDVTAVVVVLGILSFVPFAVAIEWGTRLGGAEPAAAAAPAQAPVATKPGARKRA